MIEQRKEKQRQEYSIDRNCTFKPQLAKNTDKILQERRATAAGEGSSYRHSQHQQYTLNGS